ncbi:MAG: hypothetical protein KA743_00830 [Geothrix sp.]|jgi:hypothetical protein|nr:hypothetical protein [Geothrix sp.]MCC6514619.1 hypothetical protein [Geothrix sp.]
MRSLVLLALAVLATLPLSAHGHGRGPRRIVVVERPTCAPQPRWEARHWDDRRWDDRWERRHAYRRYDCDEERIVLGLPLPRPLLPPLRGHVVIRLR